MRMKSNTYLVGLIVAILLLMFATTSFAANREISASDSSMTVYVGKQVKANVEIVKLSDDAPKQTNLIWESSDPSIAKVNNGTITGVAEGKTSITVMAKDDRSISAVIEVEVRVPVKKIVASETKIELLVGSSGEKAVFTAGVTIEPANAYEKNVVWSSSNEKVATVDKTGTIKAISKGSATITAKSAEENSSVKATINVNVKQAVESIAFAASDGC